MSCRVYSCTIPCFNKWVCSIPVTLLVSHLIYQAYSWYMTCLSSNVTNTEQTHLLKTWYSTGIYTACVYTLDKPDIYQVYYQVYDI